MATVIEHLSSVLLQIAMKPMVAFAIQTMVVLLNIKMNCLKIGLN